MSFAFKAAYEAAEAFSRLYAAALPWRGLSQDDPAAPDRLVGAGWPRNGPASARPHGRSGGARGEIGDEGLADRRRAA